MKKIIINGHAVGKYSKIAKRAMWIMTRANEISISRTPEEGSTHNAYFRRGMSGGGWGFWARAFDLAGVDCGAMNYWSGSAPTPSTAINRGIAEYIRTHAASENIPF